MRNHISPFPLQSLCDGLCTLLGVQAPTLDAGQHGLVAFTLTLNGTPFTVLQRPEADADAAFVIVEFGPLPPELELAALRQLMDANFALLGRDTPCFSRHPVSRKVLLQWPFPIATATPAVLHAGMLRAAALAEDWLDLAREGQAQPSSQMALPMTSPVAFA